MLEPPDAPKLCDGGRGDRKCAYFTPEQAVKFNAGHRYLLNNTQDILGNTTGGPVIDGPYARWHVYVFIRRHIRARINALQACLRL